MGHPKLKADNILTPNFPQNPPRNDRTTAADDLAVDDLAVDDLAADDLAAARIAQRFAPNTQPFAARAAQTPGRPAQEPSALPKHRGLIVLLAIAALLPSLVVGAAWLHSAGIFPMTANFGGKTQLPIKTQQPIEIAPVQMASVTGAALPAGYQAEPGAVLPVALAAPSLLEATAGEVTPFALALSDTSGLPARSIIAVRGLPRQGTLSAGRPHGKDGWYLRPQDIAGLRLTLPDNAQGKVTLNINLVTPGGETIASAKTHLDMKPQPASSETVAAHQQGENRQDEHQLNRGVQSFATEAIDRPEAMLVLTENTVASPDSAPVPESPQPQTTGQPQTRTSNVAAVQPDKQDNAQNTANATENAEETAKAPAQNPANNDEAQITLSEFVNLRDGPSASGRVIGVMEKGSTLRIIGRERRWLNVTDAEGTQTGWIYSRYANSAKRYRYAMRKAEPSRLGAPASDAEEDSSLLTRLGRWVVGP